MRKGVILSRGHDPMLSGKYTTSPNWEINDSSTWNKMWVHRGEPFFEGQHNDMMAKKIVHLMSFFAKDINYIVFCDDDNYDKPLVDRVRTERSYAGSLKESICIDIHANASQSHRARGFEVFHYPNSKNGKRLAECINNEVKELSSVKNRGVKTSDKFYMLRETTSPAVIIECDFFDNEEGAKDLMDEGKQWQKAMAIVLGIVKYFRL
jgi:hypothetical protein